MSDTAERIEAELSQALAEAESQADLKARAAKAERLERELALHRAGVPTEGFGRLFARTYDGPPDVQAIRLAWADESGDDSHLSPAEKIHRELRAARKSRPQAGKEADRGL